MIWSLSWRADPAAAALADRHYSRQAHGSAQFVPPGRCLVLRAPASYWVTSWPLPAYVRHRWPGAWVCSAFRREGEGPRASEMIRQAVAATRWRWTDVPELGLVTFIDRAQVTPIMVRGVPTYGRTWALAGFRPDGETVGGLMAWRMAPEDMPAPEPPIGATMALFAGAV